jgi:flagellar FliL protein
MTRSEAVVAEIELHSSRIRNDLIMAFSGMEYSEIQTAEGKELMRQQALIAVQDILTQEIDEAGIEQVLFTNLVMQ